MIRIVIQYIILFICICSITFSSSNTIDISIAANKNEYLVGEEIFLFVKFKNTGSKNDSIAEDAANLPMHISASNEKGEQPKRFNFVADYIRQPYISLKPNDSVIETVPILFYMGYGKLEHAPMGESYYFPPGEYKVYYSDSFIKIKINDAHGIDSIVSSKMINAKNIPTYVKNLEPRYQKDSVSKKMELFKEIYDNYPESPYSKKAFSLYFHYYWELNYSVDSTTFDYCKKFIFGEPDSYYVQNVLFYMCRGLKNRENDDSVVIFLNKVVEDFPNTNLSDFAKELTISKKYAW